MTPQQFKPIILKTLRDAATKKFRSVDDLADHLVSRMVDYEEMLTLAGPGVLIQTSASQAPLALEEAAAPAPAPIVLPAQDISERLTGAQAAQGLSEHFTKDELYGYYSQNLPPAITVQPPGFDKPLNLQRWLKRAPGDLGFVRIGYAPAGAEPETTSTQIQVATTDAKMNAEQALKELIDQANHIFSPTRRNVQPVRNFPVFESLEQTMSGAVSAETDRETSGADMAEWSQAMRSPKLNFRDSVE
jgi:hypothetical protein